nr:hypothetical protein CTI12_AA596350 [Tanacetum cinerariifolium]
MKNFGCILSLNREDKSKVWERNKLKLTSMNYALNYRWPTLLFGGRGSNGPMPHAWLDDEVEDMNSDDNGCIDISLLITEKDWSKVERTQDFVDYVYDKYGNITVIDEMLDDMYNFAMMKEKCLSMVEYEKGKGKLMVESEKGKEKLMVSDKMVEYVLAKLEGDLARAKQAEPDKGKAKQTEHNLDDVDLVDALDLENRIKKLKEDFSRLLKGKKIRMFKETPTTSIGPRRQLAYASTRSRGPIASTTSRAPGRQLASTSIRSRAPIASTSSAQAATTSAPRVLIVSLCVGTDTAYLS